MKTFSITLFCTLMALFSSFGVFAQPLKGVSDHAMASQVMRNKQQTYVRLYWDPVPDAFYYEVSVRKTGEKSWMTYEADAPGFELGNLEMPAVYEWKVLAIVGKEKMEVNPVPETFNTDYPIGGIQVSTRLFQAVSNWGGEEQEGVGLETYLWSRRGQVGNPEEIETFLRNFYKGNLPSETGGKALGGEDPCQCALVINDDFIGGAEQFTSHDRPYEEAGSCGWFWGENCFDRSRGAAKELNIMLRGRLKEDQREKYAVDSSLSNSLTRLKYLCVGSGCCSARIEYGAKYESQLNVVGNYNSQGAYSIDAADLVWLMETKSDGNTKLLGAPSAKAIQIYQETTGNPQFWNEILDLVVPTGQALLAIFGSGDSINWTNLASSLGNIVDEIKDVIGTDAIITETDEDGVNAGDLLFQSTGFLEAFSPNETRYYNLLSASRVAYRDAWGKRTLCGKGHINTDASVKSGFAQVFVMTDEDNGGFPGCCVDEYGKWFSHSYLGSGHQSNLQTFAGTILGCNGIFDGLGWLDNNGNPIPCNFGNPVINSPFGIATVEHNCCSGNPLFTEIFYDVECVDNVPPTDDPSGTTSSAEDEPGRCSRVKVTIYLLDCPDGNNHSLAITGVDQNGQSYNAWMVQNATDCVYTAYFNVMEGFTYFLRHTTSNGCDSETVSYMLQIPNGAMVNGAADAAKNQPGANVSNIDKGIARENTGSFLLYPNPAKGAVTVEIHLDEKAENPKFEIYNLHGQLMKTWALESNSQTSTIDLGDLPSGTYYTVVVDGINPPKPQKLVIQ